jgi:hypothetical protein
MHAYTHTITHQVQAILKQLKEKQAQEKKMKDMLKVFKRTHSTIREHILL